MAAVLDSTVWVDLSPSPAAAIDAEGRISAANGGIARCLGCEARQLLSTELAAWAADPAALCAFLRSGGAGAGEFCMRAADGSERWLEISLSTRRGDGTMLLSAFDVTARRAEREKMAEENRRFRDIIGVGGGTLYEMNAELTRIRLWERDAVTDAVRIRERDAKFPDDVIDPSFNPAELAETQRRYAAREPVRNLIYRVPSAKGEEVYRMGNSVPFYDRNGVYQGRRGVSIDVTAQVLAERALRENEALLRRAREHLEHAQRVAATGSSERDLETGALVWSEEMYRLAGVERAAFDLTDANIFGLVHEDDRERMKATVMAGRKGASPPPAEFRIRRPDGNVRTLYCETDVLRDKAGKPVRVLTVFKDVTELRAAQKRQDGM